MKATNAATFTVSTGSQPMVLIPLAEYQRLVDRTTTAGPELLDTKQAAQRYGYSADRWRRWAAAGAIDGAFQDADGGPWHLPRAACEAHVRNRKRAGSQRRGGSRPLPRGPRARRPVLPVGESPTQATGGLRVL